VCAIELRENQMNPTGLKIRDSLVGGYRKQSLRGEWQV
jgi:hypothetical protein